MTFSTLGSATSTAVSQIPANAAAKSNSTVWDAHIVRIQKIIDEYNKIKINPAPQYATLGGLYAKIENYDEALTAFGRAVELDPDNPKIVMAYSRGAQIYRIRNEFEKALGYLSKAVQLIDDDNLEDPKISKEEKIRIDNEVKFLFEKSLNMQSGSLNQFKDYEKLASQCVALGVRYAKKESYDEAMNAFERAIELDPDNPKIVMAYSRGAQIYRIRNEFEKAWEFLSKAVDFFDDISKDEKTRIEKEMDLVKEKLPSELPRMQSGSMRQPPDGPQAPDRVSFFAGLLGFIEDQCSSAPQVMESEKATHYWRAYGFVTKALQREQNSGTIDAETQMMYLKAKNDLDILVGINQKEKSYTPSFIWFVRATINFKLAGAYEKQENEVEAAKIYMINALENLDNAIAYNPDESFYFRARSIIHEMLGNEEEAQKDRENYQKKNPLEPDQAVAQREYNIVNKEIIFYDQIKSDKITYFSILKMLAEQDILVVSNVEMKSLTPKSLAEHLKKAGISLAPLPSSIYDPITEKQYNELCAQGHEIALKKGSTLPPIELLHLRRAQCLAILAQRDPLKLDKAIADIQFVLESTRESNPDLYLQALLGRSRVLCKFERYSEALTDAKEALRWMPDNVEVQSLIAEIARGLELNDKGKTP